MPLDPSIILGVKPAQIDTPEQYEQKSLTLQKLRQEGETGKLGLETARQAQADEQAVRQAYQQSGGDPAALRRALQLGGQHKQLQALDKFELEKREKEANISLHGAQGNKAQWEVDKGKLEHGAAMLDLVRDQQSFEQVLRLGQMNGTFKPEFVAQALQQGYSPQLVESLKTAGLTRAQQLEVQNKQATLAQTTANDPFRAGPGGVPVAQPEVQAFQTGKARAGAAKTNIINQTGGSLAHQVGPMMKDSTEAAQAAVQQVTAAQQIVRAVDSGRIITGPLADKRLVLARVGQAIGVGGATEAERIANTQTAVRNLAQLTLQGRQQMRGQGAITVSEGELAQRAVSGDIDLSAAEIRALANAAERAGRFIHGEHTRKLNAMRQNPQLQEVVPFYEGPAMPPPVTAPGVNPATLSDTELRRELNNPRPR